MSTKGQLNDVVGTYLLSPLLRNYESGKAERVRPPTWGSRNRQTREARQFGRTEVRPYNTLQFNALQKPPQKGADYIAKGC